MQKEKKEKNQEKKRCQPRGRLLLTGARGFLLVVLDAGRRISLHSNAASPRCLSVSLSHTNSTIRQHSAREAVGVWGKGGFSCSFSCLVGPGKAGDIACGRTDLSLVALLGPWCLWRYLISATRPLLLRGCPYCITLPVLLRQNAVRGRGVGGWSCSPWSSPVDGRANHRSCHIAMDMQIHIISKIEIALLPLSYHELASRLTGLAAMVGLYCLCFLVSGRDCTEFIQLNWEIQSKTARARE